MGDSFDDVIKEHLDLKRRNGHLEATLPLQDYQPEPGPVHNQTGEVFDAEAEGAAFNTTEWNSNQWSDIRHAKPRRKAETFLESLEDVSSGLDFSWDKKPRGKDPGLP